MAGFQTFGNSARVPAEKMRRVIDPADWTAESLGPVGDWSYWISGRDAEELVAGVAAFRRKNLPLVEVNKDNFPLGAFANVLADVRRELIDGRGIVMLKGFPLDRFDREDTAIAYMGLCSYVGPKMVQNHHGHVLGHVKNIGGDYSRTRGYDTNAELRFHTDGCDYVGLLCLQTAMSGGASRVVSAVRMYNTILERRPDLCALLCEDYYRDMNGEVSEGEKNFFPRPIFAFVDGYFSAAGAGATLERAQQIPEVPKWTPAQREAVELYRAMAEELAVDIEFACGDIQFLSNYVVVHSRRAYEDWPEPHRKRHLLRLWLGDSNGRPIPKAQREGRAGRGIQIKGVKLTAPLDVDEDARALRV